MLTHYILDADGHVKPVTDLLEWAKWFQTAERTIALSGNEGNVWVSTVFLGINHNWFGDPPILWESMVFGGPSDGDCQRYSSREAALKGHEEMCRRVLAPKETPCVVEKNPND